MEATGAGSGDNIPGICSYTIYMRFFIDYNPLMGGGGSGYRPERRGFSAGGGG